MRHTLKPRLVIAAGLLLARIAMRALPEPTADEARWVAGALEVLLFAAEAWARRGSPSLREPRARRRLGPLRGELLRVRALRQPR